MPKRLLIPPTLLLLVMAGQAGAQKMDESMQEAATEYSAWIDAIAEFTDGVEFDEDDLRSFLEHWPEMNELDFLEDDDYETAAEFQRDVREVLADPRYRSWTSKRGLDPEDWMRASMRITSVVMLREMAAQEEMMASQRQQYAAMVEQQCAQVSEDVCQQMRQAMASSMAMADAMLTARDKLAPPSDTELALLEQYNDELEAAMQKEPGNDSDYEDYEDYDED